MKKKVVKNYIDGRWENPLGQPGRPVLNPASQEGLADFKNASLDDLERAVKAAQTAFPDWRATPAGDRVQPLFMLLNKMREEKKSLAKTITFECGKTYQESLGELTRAIENLEVACGIPSLSQGAFSEDIARGIDEILIRQPVGISAVICPFNFPAMIAFWFLPYALACGNPVIVKPSERVPLTMMEIFRLIDESDFPRGVVQMLQGGPEIVNGLIEAPDVRSISFVGSTPVAQHVYTKAAAAGKRAQCQGGAKNPIVVMPDADPEMTLRIIADSAYGCAGQRCLAASLVIPVGDSIGWLREGLREAALNRRVGFGLEEGIQMGPVITPESQQRIESLIAEGVREGAELLVDGRGAVIPGYEEGNFINPTILDNLPAEGTLAQTEVFGPVLGVMPMQTLQDAIHWINQSAFGNMACIFTARGANARQFRHEAQAGNIGVNIGVAAPMAFFPFTGWKNSFFGDLHGQAMDAVEFFTQKKVVVERWPEHWSRQF
jgi:malonate-semialdehyde dehydrogenase (acetylating) / methylmalonate-semialdehyde dehydrogenase